VVRLFTNGVERTSVTYDGRPTLTNPCAAVGRRRLTGLFTPSLSSGGVDVWSDGQNRNTPPASGTITRQADRFQATFARALRASDEVELDSFSQTTVAGGDVRFVTFGRVQSVCLLPVVLGRSVNASVLRGVVRVKVPGSKRFTRLTGTRQIPVRSILDTRRGSIRLSTATGVPGATQSAEFSAGVFQVLQSRSPSAKGLTELRLRGGSFRGCGAHVASLSALFGQAARHTRRIRRLRGRGSGRFRTRGRYSSATVRGTDWSTTDRCDGTLTQVKSGKVAVRDLRRRKTVIVRAGRSYLARRR